MNAFDPWRTTDFNIVTASLGRQPGVCPCNLHCQSKETILIWIHGCGSHLGNDAPTMDTIEKVDVLPYFSLVYGSRATRTFTASDLKQLMQRAQAKNQRSRITGFLHHHDGKFFQFLEGNRQRVLELMKTITADPRHQVLRVVHLGQAGARRFPNWSMRWIEAESVLGLETVVEQVVVDGANAIDDDTMRPILVSLCERLAAKSATNAMER